MTTADLFELDRLRGLLAEKNQRIKVLESALMKELEMWTMALRPGVRGTLGYGMDGEFIENRVLALRAALGGKL